MSKFKLKTFVIPHASRAFLFRNFCYRLKASIFGIRLGSPGYATVRDKADFTYVGSEAATACTVDGRRPAAGISISEALELGTLILMGFGLIAFGTVLTASRYSRYHR